MLKFLGILFLIGIGIVLGGLYLLGKFTKFMKSFNAPPPAQQKRTKYNDEVVYDRDDVVVMKGKSNKDKNEGY